MQNNKEIILIGGAPGTGKTTLANQWAYEKKIDHRLGTGFIREIIKSVEQRSDSVLHSYTFDVDDPISNLEIQSEILFPHVLSCIHRAQREGTSLIIEGSHLIPSLYYKLKSDNLSYYILYMEGSENEHLKRVLGDTHTKRQIDPKQLNAIRAINEYYLEEVSKYEITLIKQ